nr:putative ribonuclease H-like domain-containing protein [Tanacetum cinerariifolium]
MDVKSAFLYGTIDEKVYVMQPLGFQDPEFPARVYKVENAMYGLHQAPRAWYGTLSKSLLSNGFQRGTIDQILFIRRHRGDFILVQVIETTDEGTKILATVDGKLRTISESSIRRNLKLNDEAGISTLLDAELFENLALMGVNNPSFSGRTVPLFDTMLVHQGEGSGTPTEPHHTPSPEAQQSSHIAPSSPSLPPAITETIPTLTPIDIPTLRQFSRRVRIAQSSTLPTAADKPASPLGDDSQREACPTVSGLEAKQDRANILKTSTLPHDSTPMVTSLVADEGSMQQQLFELMDLCAEPSGEDATIKGKSLEIGDEAVVERSTERGSNDTEELVNVLTSLDATNILTSRVQVVSVPPAAEVSTVGIPTGSGMVPTASPIFTTASVVTPYSRRKAREMEEQMVKEDQRRNEHIARDAEIARIHAEEELQILIDGLDRNNETVAKYPQEYEQFAADLSIGEKIDMINELVKYQDHYAKLLKYQSQQSKPISKKQQREFYMSVLKSHLGWKTKNFKGVSLEKIKEKFILVWKQIEDFVPMASKEEGERFKRKGLRLEQESPKKMKTSEEVSQEDLKEMMQLVLVEELWTLVKETLSIRQATSDKEKELWVELKRLFEPDVEDQLWTYTQALMHDPVEWRLYDSCGVHHVLTRDQEIFMLVEEDYPLRKGLAIVMISNKLQVENYSQMASDLILKIHNIANSPKQRDD